MEYLLRYKNTWYTTHGTRHMVVQMVPSTGPSTPMVPHCGGTHSRLPYDVRGQSAGRGTRAVCERVLLDMDMAGIYFRSSLGAAGGGKRQLPREQSAVL